VEPDRLISTSSEGLSARTEIEAPCFFKYGSRTLSGARTWQGKFFFPARFAKERCAFEWLRFHLELLSVRSVFFSSQKSFLNDKLFAR
jgi:hypothetical protein